MISSFIYMFEMCPLGKTVRVGDDDVGDTHRP